MMPEPPRPVRVVAVVPLTDLHVQLDFDDGVSRTVDLTPYVQSPAYKQVRLSEKYFRTVQVENGAIVWDNGSMLDADLLRYGPPKVTTKPEKPKVHKLAARPTKAKAKPKPVKAKPKAKVAAKAPAKKAAKAIKPAKKVKPVKRPAKAAKPAKKTAKKKK